MPERAHTPAGGSSKRGSRSGTGRGAGTPLLATPAQAGQWLAVPPARLRQEPAPEVFGAAVGQAQHKVRDGVLACARLARAGLEMRLAQWQDLLLHLVWAEALGTQVVYGFEHCTESVGII